MKILFSRLLRDLWRRVFLRVHYRRKRWIGSLEGVVDPKPDEILLIGDDGKPKWAILKCPCGCSEMLHVNLMKSHYPHWELTEELDGNISLSPSLWIDQSRCGSHFFIWHGRIIWCYTTQEHLAK